MSEVTKVTETSSQGLELVNPKLIGQYNQIFSLLNTRLTRDHALLFAEPVPLGSTDSAGNDTVWYTKGVGSVRPLASLPPDHVVELHAQLERLIDDIQGLSSELTAGTGVSRELGMLLRDMLVFPEKPEVFLVNDRPVLVNWGYRRAHAGPGSRIGSEGVLTGMAIHRQVTPVSESSAAKPDSNSHTSESDNATASAEDQSSAPVDVTVSLQRRISRCIVGALWCGFAFLGVLIGWRVLGICTSMPTNWPAFIRAGLSNSCGQSTDAADLRTANEAIRIMEASLRHKRLEIATKLGRCEAACLPSGNTLRPINPDDGRLNNMPRGKVEVTLAWNGPADIDLHVFCPNGERIGHDFREKCGGRLAQDLNAGGGGPSATPVEHIVWSSAPVPNGTYVVRAALYARASEPRPDIPFTAVLRVDNVIVKTVTRTINKTYLGVNGASMKTLFSFDVPADTSGSK